MTIDELRALGEQRRSIRGYDEERQVPDEMLHAILDCAWRTLSGGNGQPWEFIVVRDQATHYKIADNYLKQMEPKREMDIAARGTAKITGAGFRHAPVHIVILGDPRIKQAYPIRTQLEKIRVSLHYGPGQCHLADTLGRDFASPGFAIRERRQLA